MTITRLAYLAPEIPALSATFVYNEILVLETLGFSVAPFSVHHPAMFAQDDKLKELSAKVTHLYSANKLSVLAANLRMLVRHPGRYVNALSLLTTDIRNIGLFKQTALGLIFRFCYSALLAQNLIAQQVQHLHAHFAHVPGDLAMYAAELAGIPFSITAHANDLFERGWLLPQKVSRAKFFVTISEYNKAFLQRQGCTTERVAVVHCGVDPTQFKAVNQNRQPGTPPKIGFVGRLIEKKGAADLLYAAHELKLQGIPFRLQLGGSGPLETQLKTLATSLGLNNQDIDFLGPIAHSSVADFLRQLDLFVLPCVKDANGDMDGIPVVLMEAMLSGIPVISTRLSGIPELVVDQGTGLLVEPGDHNALAAAIRRLLDDPTLAMQLNLQAVAKINKEFNLKDNVAQLAALFKQT